MQSQTKKRKHIVLTIEKKVEIINRLATGESGTALARIYGIGKTTISNIKSKTEHLLEYAMKLEKQGGSKKRKTMKYASYKELESDIYAWYCQCRSEGISITGPQLCEKALDINRERGGCAEFKASTGWLQKFKIRHGIKWHAGAETLDVPKTTREDPVVGNSIQQPLIDMIDLDGYSKDNIYHVEMTVLAWNSLPDLATVPIRDGKVTYAICSSACGKHVLPLLVIGETRNPLCLQNVANPPVNYKFQKNASFDAEVLQEWYVNDFVPLIKQRQKIYKTRGKVLLIMDSIFLATTADYLNAIDDNFKVMYVSSDDMIHVEPFYYGIVEKVNRIYKKLFLRRLLLHTGTLLTFLQIYSLKDFCYALAEAWESVSEVKLSNALKNIYGGAKSPPVPEPTEKQILDEFVDLLQSVPEYQDCNFEDVQTWLEDDPDCVLRLHDSDVEACDSDTEEEEEDMSFAMPSEEEALAALETAMTWFEQQSESSQDDYMQLRKIRDLAAKKLMPYDVQEKIDKYFA